MSREAMEAVQMHSKYQSPEDYYRFRVLLSIASFADGEGVAGIAGEYTRCPSYRAIAERARVHRNIIGGKIAELIDGGELSIEAQGGAGRGSWTVYRINLPIDSVSDSVSIHERMPHSTGEEQDITLVTIVQELAHQVELMAHELSHLRQLLSHENGTFGTRVQRENVTDTNEIPLKQEKPKENIYIRGGIADEVDTNPIDAAALMEMRTAICAVIKTTYVPHKNGDDFDGAAEAFLRDGITIEQVDSFGDWWAANGYYRGKPSLKTLIDEIKNSVSRPNGKSPVSLDGQILTDGDGQYVVVDGKPQRIPDNATA